MHKNALHALLPTGIGRSRRGNPAASLRLAQTYATPVLLSGLNSLVLNKAELKILDGHYLSTLQRLLRLHEKSPRSIIYYMAGSLPASAILHQRQMSLFSMICHLKDDPLHQQHAYHVLLRPQTVQTVLVSTSSGYLLNVLSSTPSPAAEAARQQEPDE